MNSSRVQHLVPGTAVLLLAIIVAWLSFTQEPAAAYLFPRLIALVMLALAIWNFVRAAGGLARVGSGLDGITIKRTIPGIIVALILVFWAAKALGFYLASTIAFFAVYSAYDPASHLQVLSWLKRLVVTLLFMAVIYLLFAMLLKVQTPRGLFM